MQTNEGFTPLELEAMRRARAGEKVALVDGGLKPADLAEKEREFIEVGGEIAAPAWGQTPASEPEPVKSDAGERLAAIYEAAGAPVQRPVQAEPERGAVPPNPVQASVQAPPEDSVQSSVQAASPAMPCQRCGYVPGTPFVDEPSAEDQRLFVRSVLGRKRFTKTFHFFGEADGMDATFRNVLPGEYDVIRKVMQWMIRSGDARVPEDQFIFQQNAIAIVSAVSANLDDEDSREFDPPDISALYEEGRTKRRKASAEKSELPPEPEEAVHDEITRRAAGLGPVLLILTQGSYRMEELYRMLVARAHDRGFWSGASGE